MKKNVYASGYSYLDWTMEIHKKELYNYFYTPELGDSHREFHRDYLPVLLWSLDHEIQYNIITYYNNIKTNPQKRSPIADYNNIKTNTQKCSPITDYRGLQFNSTPITRNVGFTPTTYWNDGYDTNCYPDNIV